MTKRKNNLKSDCCRAKIKYSYSSIAEYLICTQCNKPCNYYVTIRKTWKINPSTKIKKDERAKNKRKFTDKELKKIHQEEDF